MGLFSNIYNYFFENKVLLKLDQALLLLGTIQGKEDIIMAQIDDLKTAVVNLVGTVTNQTTVIDSAVAAFKGLTDQIALLSQQLADAIAAGNPAAIQEAADALAGLNQEVINQTAALAAAIPAGTPA